MGRLGLAFEVVAADVDETPLAGEDPAELALRLAGLKARAVTSADSDPVVVAADTVVARGRRLYGKPADLDDARGMLRELVGREHRVVTGVAVVGSAGAVFASATSRVWLRNWSSAEIDAYVASEDPLDKAGAYAIQNELFRPVARLSGCRCNVVGFPLALVRRMLGEVGVAVPIETAAACPYAEYSARRCG